MRMSQPQLATQLRLTTCRGDHTPGNVVSRFTPSRPYTTYVIGARIPKGSVPPILLWDDRDFYEGTYSH